MDNEGGVSVLRIATLKEIYLSLPSEFRDKLRGKVTQLLGELAVLEELKKQKHRVELKFWNNTYELFINDKRTEIKVCNIDDAWVKLRGITGCSGINTKNFDVLIYVEFDDSLKNFACYIFSRDEAENFPNTLQGEKIDSQKATVSENRTLENPFNPSHFRGMTMDKAIGLNNLLKKSLGNWDKIQ